MIKQPINSYARLYDDNNEQVLRHEGLPEALLWDMDGTLLDTEQYWQTAQKDLLKAHNCPSSDFDP